MSLYFYACVFFLMRRRPPISTRMTHSFPTLRSSDLYTGDDALGYVLSLNLYRRQLTVAQRALIAAELSRSEEHTSELQSLMRISYAVFCMKKKNNVYTKFSTNNKHNINFQRHTYKINHKKPHQQITKLLSLEH